MRMLVVSAHGINQELVQNMIDPTKCSFLNAAKSAQEAIQTLGEESCDVVWIDSYRLGCPPNELAKKIREMRPGILTVLWTTGEEADLQCFNLRIVKPTRQADMNEAVLNLMVMHGG